METRFPAHQLRELGCLSGEEIEIFQLIPGPLLQLPGRSVIRQEGARDRSLYLLIEGWASSSVTLGHGQRHILKLHLPGEILGSTSMCVDEAVDTLTAVTPVKVRKIPLQTIGALITKAPQIATALLLLAQKERIGLMDRAAALAQSSSARRLAFFLVSIRDRVAAFGELIDETLHLPISQEEIGDVMGITSVHVNRTLHKFENEGLIARKLRTLKFLDVPGLRHLAGAPRRSISRDCGWLEMVSGAPASGSLIGI